MFKKPLYLVLTILMLVTIVAAAIVAVIHFSASEPEEDPVVTATFTPSPTLSAEPTASPTPTRTPSPAEQPDAAPDEAAMGTSFEAGASGEQVALLQEKLMELYYLPYGTPTAEYDEATTEAVMLFQQRNALPLTGIADEATVSALFSGEPNYLVGLGMAGPDVALIQGRLSALGYAASQTGTFDEQTQAALKAFQNKNGLTESGIADRACADALLSRDAVTFSGEVSGHNFTANSLDHKGPFIEFASSLEGMPRSAAGRGPRYFNSAGYVFYSMRRAGIYTKYMDAAAWQTAPYETIEDISALAEGDILVFDGHVGIYLTDGSMLHCSSATGCVTRTKDVMEDPYFAKTFICAKRMF